MPRSGVISVTMINTGEATNVIPESCVVEGTVRTCTTEVLDLIERRMKTIAESTCAAFECACEFEFVRNSASVPGLRRQVTWSARPTHRMSASWRVRQLTPSARSRLSSC